MHSANALHKQPSNQNSGTQGVGFVLRITTTECGRQAVSAHTLLLGGNDGLLLLEMR